MAEIGVAISIIQLVQLSGAVLSSCYEYVSKARNAPADIQRIVNEIGSLKVILEHSRLLTSDPNDGRIDSLKSLSEPNGPFHACFEILLELEKKLKAINDASSVRRKLLWPLESGKIDEILHKLEKHKTTFILAFAGNNNSLAMANGTAVEQVRSQLDEMKFTEQRNKILKWLKGADPTTNHNAARRKHEPGTGDWLINSEQFQSWKERDGDIMWLHGIPGAGKTVLSSLVIDQLSAQCEQNPGSRLAYFYFDFNDHGKQTAVGCLQSLTRQLFDQCDVIPEKLQSLHDDCKHGTPSLAQLTDSLASMLSESATTFIVIDALDECREEDVEREREGFFESLKEIKSAATGINKIFITSRPEPDIQRELSDLNAIQSPLRQDDVNEDIRSHVRACLAKDARFKKWPQTVKQDIENTLAKGACGMFRWAVCQLDSLRKCLKPANVRRDLKNLPKTLEDTYARIFKKIPKGYEREMRTVLTFLAFSTRPMTIQEVAEATAVNLDTRSFSEDERFPDPYDLLELCSSLVSLADLGSDSGSALKRERSHYYSWSGEIKIIQFAHFSVKEYILSESARKAVPSELYIESSLSQRYLTEACLIYLLDFSGGDRVTNFDHDEFPFLAYAALHWTSHLTIVPEQDQASIESLLIRLFDPEKSNSLMNYLNLYNPLSSWNLQEADRGSKTLAYCTQSRNRQDFETPLYYACYYGLTTVAAALLGKGTGKALSTDILGSALEVAASGGHVEIVAHLLREGADPNAHYCRQFHRPLQAAAFSGSAKTVELLLNAGADVKAHGGELGTALHVAAKQGNPQVIKQLINHGHEVSPWVQLYGTPLTTAARYGNDDAVAMLVHNGADPNIYGGPYFCALIAACEFSSIDSVKILLDAGAEINRRDTRGNPLHCAAERGSMDIMRLLIARGADVDGTGGTYGTPLKAAIQSHDPAVFRLMLESGADINARGSGSKYPVDQAIFGGNLEAAEKLLELGAKFGDTALEQALDYSGKEFLVKTLLGLGADPNAEHEEKGNMLQLAVDRCAEETIKWLLEAGADVNAVEGEYGSALQAAAANGNEEIIRLLLDHGAEPNLPNCGKYGNPLQAAIVCENEPVVQLLLEKGADVNSRGGVYETP